MTNRNSIFDLMKGVGIILVICGHVFREFTFFHFSPYNFIFSFHMPLFFFISGMLYHKKEKYVLKKAFSLGVPYISFALLSFLYWILIESKFRSYAGSTTLQFTNIFFPMNIRGGYEFNAVLWFLPALFFCSIMFYVIEKMAQEYKIVFIILLVIVIAYDSLFYDNWIPFYIPQALCALPFFITGNQVCTYLGKFNIFIKKRPSLTIATSLTCLFAIGIFSPKFDMLWCIYNNCYLIFFFTALLAIICTYSCMVVVDKNRVLEWFGKNSLIIMLIHEPIKRIILKLYSVILHIPIDSIRTSLLPSLIVIFTVLCSVVPFVMVINKYTPFLIGKPFRKE